MDLELLVVRRLVVDGKSVGHGRCVYLMRTESIMDCDSHTGDMSLFMFTRPGDINQQG